MFLISKGFNKTAATIIGYASFIGCGWYVIIKRNYSAFRMNLNKEELINYLKEHNLYKENFDVKEYDDDGEKSIWVIPPDNSNIDEILENEIEAKGNNF